MKGRSITIIFDIANDSYGDLISRIRNLGEELYREFEETQQASMSIDEVDRAVDRLSLHVITSRHLGDVMALVKKTLERHNLADRATVERAHGNA